MVCVWCVGGVGGYGVGGCGYILKITYFSDFCSIASLKIRHFLSASS